MTFYTKQCDLRYKNGRKCDLDHIKILNIFLIFIMEEREEKGLIRSVYINCPNFPKKINDILHK